MTTSVNIQSSGFSEFTIINSQGFEYKYQISSLQAFFDIFRALVGAETSLNKLERVYNDIYSDQPDKASSAVCELISCVKNKYQQDFHITFDGENDEKKLKVCFQDLELVALPCRPFSNEINLFPHIENKGSYKNYLTLCFTEFLRQELLPALNQLETDVSKPGTVEKEKYEVYDAFCNLRQGVIMDYAHKMSVLSEIYNCHEGLTDINGFYYIDTMLSYDLGMKPLSSSSTDDIGLSLAGRKHDEQKIIAQIGDWASKVKNVAIKFNSDVYSAIIDDIKDQLFFFKEPAAYQKLKENDSSLYSMSSMLKAFEFLESTDGVLNLPFNTAFLVQHHFILDNMKHIKNAIHEMKHNPGNVNATSDALALFNNILLQERNARIASISHILLHKLLPVMVKASNLEDATGIGKSFESQLGNSKAMEELNATIDKMMTYDMIDFFSSCKELEEEYFISPHVIEENRFYLDKVLALNTDSNSFNKKYKNYKLMCDNIMIMAGNIYGHFIQEIGDYLMILNGSSKGENHDQLVYLKELLSAFDFLRCQGYYDFTELDDVCAAQGMLPESIEAIHDTILSADIAVKEMMA